VRPDLLAAVAARVAGAADDADAVAGVEALLAEAHPGVRRMPDGRFTAPPGAEEELAETLELVAALLREGPLLRRTARLAQVGRLAGGVVHDLSNSLSAIAFRTAVIAQQVEPADPLAEEIAELRRLAESSAELVRRLLRIGRGAPSQPDAIDLAGAVRDALPALERDAGAAVEVRLGALPEQCLVTLPRGALEHLLGNLVANARNAMPDGGSVLVTANGDGEHVTLEVRDSGRGMPEAVRRRALEPFFTTHSATGGTGLGLAAVADLVGLAGGRVELESREGEGTTVLLHLPCHDPARASAPRARVHRLLLADGPGAHPALGRELEASGYEVVRAFGAEHALDLATATEFDAAIAAPGAGSDLARRLRAARPDLPLVEPAGEGPEALLRALAELLRD
jgi:signal transduction histidine kinase